MDKLTLTKFKSCGFTKTTPAGKLIYLLLEELSFFENSEVIISQRVIANALNIAKQRN